LTEGSAIVLDARPYDEYAVSHIPGARAVPAKPGTTPALYVGDADEVAKSIPDKTQPLILYCNGLFCGRSERLAADLIKLGYENVRRYQLRSRRRHAGGKAGIGAAACAECDLSIGRWKSQVRLSIPLSEASQTKYDGRLPMTDHNTRILVVGNNKSEARTVAEAIVRDAFHNVGFFGGSIADLPELLEDEEG